MDDQDHPGEARPADPGTRRLLHDLTVLDALVADDRASADERLATMLEEDRLQVLLAELATPPSWRKRVMRAAGALVDKAVHRLGERSGVTTIAHLKQWQRSLFFIALGCGAAVSLVGTIDLIWHLRAVFGGLGAVSIVVAVFLQTRHRPPDHHWIGS